MTTTATTKAISRSASTARVATSTARGNGVDRQRDADVLIVDDHEDVRGAISSLLGELGYRCFQANDGVEALALMTQHRPDAIILDLMLPRMNGWQLWDELQQRPQLSSIPVVVITASGFGPGSFGSTPVLRKPFDVDALVDLVDAACRQER